MGRRKRTLGRRLEDLRDRLRLDLDRRILLAAALLVGLIGLGAAAVAGVPRLEHYVSQRHRAQAPQVHFADLPDWAHRDLQQELQQLAGEHLGSDPLRRGDLVAAWKALSESGWFTQVAQVRRLPGGVVQITGHLAVPMAVVRDPATALDHLIGSRSQRLPRSYPAGSAEGLAVITGVPGPPPAIGSRWEGQEVGAALQLLDLVAARPWRGQIAAVQVSRQGTAPWLRLLTHRGCSITWGRCPGREDAAEVPAERKLAYLDYHHAQYGHIDRGHLREMDVTGDVVVGR